MKGKSKSVITLTIIVAFSAMSVKAQRESIQAFLEELTVGKSGREELVKYFGTPTETRKISEWTEEKSKNQIDLYVFPDRLNRPSAGRRRSLFEWKYPQQKISFWLLDNPWQINSIEISTSEIVISGLRVGDELERLEELFGEADWSTTENSDSWIAEYESKGLQFRFARDMDEPKYPMKLTQPAVIRSIEIFDNNVSFLSR